MNITVPLVEFPLRSGHLDFFSNPLLWILILENIAVIYLYRKLKVAISIHAK